MGIANNRSCRFKTTHVGEVRSRVDSMFGMFGIRGYQSRVLSHLLLSFLGNGAFDQSKCQVLAFCVAVAEICPCSGCMSEISTRLR
jgi:hypothetical protein